MTALAKQTSSDAAEPEEPRTRRRRRTRVGSRRLPYVLVIPAGLAELFIHIIPLVVGIGISLLQLTQFYIRDWTRAPWAGTHNFDVALSFDGPIGAGLLRSFQTTVLFTVAVVALTWAFGMAAALLVNGEFRGQRWFRTLFLVPFAMPVYVGVIAWAFVLDRDNGALNRLLVDDLGVVDERPFWLLGNNAFWSMLMTSVWRLWPFAFLMILAGLQNIPRQLYEAAAVDGAGVIRQWRAITLPMLRPVTNVLLLVLFLWTFNEFNAPYVLFGPSPPEAADLLSLHIYINSFVNLNFGLGSAMSVLLLGFLMCVTLIYIKVVRLGSEQDV
jgi:multiple sugar transport system permease protein